MNPEKGFLFFGLPKFVNETKLKCIQQKSRNIHGKEIETVENRK